MQDVCPDGTVDVPHTHPSASPQPPLASPPCRWYLEWHGEEQRGHPAALHPAVYVLTAAFDSLDSERAARQPLGLFGRLRTAKAARKDGGAAEGGTAAAQQAEQRGGWRKVVAEVLRFHGVKR